VINCKLIVKSKNIVPVLCSFVLALGVVIPISTVDTIAANTNLARGKSVINHDAIGADSWKAENLVDGITTSQAGLNGFSTNNGRSSQDAEEQFTIDLGGATAFNKVIIYPRTDETVSDDNNLAVNFPVNFLVEASDNADFTGTPVVLASIAGKTTTIDTPVTVNFSQTTARYVRLKATKLGMNEAGSGFRLQLAEFEIYNVVDAIGANEKNLSEGKEVINHDAIPNNEWGASNLTDGTTTSIDGKSGYSSNNGRSSQDTEENFTIDLGEATNYNRVRLYPRTNETTSDSGNQAVNFPENFVVEASDNADFSGTPTVLAIVRGMTATIDTPVTIDFQNNTSRYIRLKVTRLGQNESNGGWRLQLAEFGIYKVTLDQEIAQEVIDAIKELPAVDDVTVDDEQDVLAKETLYNALTEGQKALVTNYSNITALKEKIKELKEQSNSTPTPTPTPTKTPTNDPTKAPNEGDEEKPSTSDVSMVLSLVLAGSAAFGVVKLKK
jgi:hypothetical protein